MPPTTADSLQEEALGVVSRLAKEFPNQTDPIGLMGMVYNDLGRTAEAMECWESCLKRNPNRPDVYQAMSRVALDRGDYQRAVDFSRQALGLHPHFPAALTVLAEALLGLGKPKEAIAVLDDEIRAPTERGQTDWRNEGYCLAGRAYQQLGEHEKAYGNYRKAVEIQPDSARAYYGLATACARLGQPDKAKQYMEKFKTLKARDLEAHMSLRSRDTDVRWVSRIVARTHTNAGRIYRGHGKLQEAEAHWLKAGRLDPENVICRQELASLYERTGRDREALEICKQLSTIDPKNASYHFNVGVLYARTSQIRAALASVGRALDLDPDNTKYRQAYEQIREAN